MYIFNELTKFLDTLPSNKKYNDLKIIEMDTNIDNDWTWNDAEIIRPKNGQDIIFYDVNGMFKGTYRNHKNGQVLVNNSIKDIIDWDDIHEWVKYPKH